MQALTQLFQQCASNAKRRATGNPNDWSACMKGLALYIHVTSEQISQTTCPMGMEDLQALRKPWESCKTLQVS